METQNTNSSKALMYRCTHMPHIHICTLIQECGVFMQYKGEEGIKLKSGMKNLDLREFSDKENC